jgi:hypothetical protein
LRLDREGLREVGLPGRGGLRDPERRSNLRALLRERRGLCDADRDLRLPLERLVSRVRDVRDGLLSAMTGQLYPWLQNALSGVFVLRNLDRTAFEQIVQQAVAAYRGPDFGGLDLMPPNHDREAWVLLGRWVDCFTDEVQLAARNFNQALTLAIDLANAGISRTGATVTVSVGTRERVELVPWWAYDGGVLVRWWQWPAGELERLQREVFPKVPAWIGMRDGAPHWLGVGMQGSGGHITSVTPYAKLQLVPNQGIRFLGMASERDYRAWLSALRAETSWF